MDAFPMWVISPVTLLLVVAAIEVGYRLGTAARRRSEDEKESPVSAITGTVLALLAFIMAFTFSIVSERYDARKALVREEAAAIRNAWLRSDFLAEPDRGEAGRLLKKYVDARLDAVQAHDLAQVQRAVEEAGPIQRRLWDMAVANARKDMNSDVGALYIESVNDLTNVHAMRVAIGLQARIPAGIWMAFYALVALSMLAVGYHTAIASSRRSLMMLILALSFTLVLTLIAALDTGRSRYLPVSQQPLEDVRALMNAGMEGSSH
ncbi:MAG: hypothetical protein ACM3NQ_25025 [Bacteroidales bacterium]